MLAGAINTNVNALYALNALTNTANKTSTFEQQLSSGQSISSPADNPAGYIAAQGFTTQIGGNEQAVSNVNQAISLVQTADGALTQQINLLEQIQNISNQAANGINNAQQLQSLQQVVSQLQTQVTTISQQTVFNGRNLLDGSFNGIQFQVGASEGQTIGLSIASTNATQLGANQSSAAAAGLYAAGGSASGGVGDVSGNSYAITAAGAGAFTAGTIGISGSAGGANYAVTANEAAKDIAASINAVTAEDECNGKCRHQRGVYGYSRFCLVCPRQRQRWRHRPTASILRQQFRACHRAGCSRWLMRLISRLARPALPPR